MAEAVEATAEAAAIEAETAEIETEAADAYDDALLERVALEMAAAEPAAIAGTVATARRFRR